MAKIDEKRTLPQPFYMHVLSINGRTLVTAMAIIAATLLLSSCSGWSHSGNDQGLRVSGRIEGVEARLGFLTPGRVQSVSVHEGDAVKKSQLLVALDDEQVRVAEHGADDVVDATEKEEKQANSELAMLKQQARLVSSLAPQVEQAELHVAMIKAELAKCKAERDNARTKAKLFQLSSPVDGICTAENVEPNESVMPGQTLVRVLDPQSVYLRAFVPESAIGDVRVGDSADVYLDSSPNRALSARVAAVDSQSAFTPENVYFKDDRVKQIFGVKLALEHPDGTAKPGMPADAVIHVRGSRGANG